MEALVVGSVFTILGLRLSPNKRNSLYAVGIGILLGLLMSRRTGTNRVDWVLKKNNLKRVKGRDLQKVGMSLKDVTRYGDILGFDLREGADKKHTYKWVDRFGGPTVLTSAHKPSEGAWLLYKDLAEEKKSPYGLSRADLYQIHHWYKRLKKGTKYTE